MQLKLPLHETAAASIGGAALYWLTRDRRRRWVALAALDGVLLGLAMVLAFALQGPPLTWSVVPWFVALAVAAKGVSLHLFRLYQVSWRYFSVRDMMMLVAAVTLGTLVTAIAVGTATLAQVLPAVAPQVLVVDYLLSMALLASLRSSRRVESELFRRAPDQRVRRVLIVGAGSTGEQVVRRLQEEPGSSHRAVGFVDDNLVKHGSTIHGIRVLGSRAEIPGVAARVRPNELWIAMPSAPRAVIRETVEIGRKAGFPQVKIVPGLGTLLSGRVRLSDIREVRPEDLLGREVVQTDTMQVRKFLGGRRVLVTGAAGSIGSELCRQAAQFDPSLLILLDQDETGVFNIHSDLAEACPEVALRPVVASVHDDTKVNAVFMDLRPEVVLHAAAYKHVPLMEQHPEEAIRTNVLGTQAVAAAALNWGCAHFVLISTDKAVNPTSVMGATKRAAETVIQNLGPMGNTKFVSVRFGNVLGSRGSVVPIFQEQIRRGGPVTVTDPEMRRYFMTIPEAVLLVLQAGAIGESGQVLVLDMGEPVKVLDLARQMIVLSGLEPDRDIPIVFTGLRPGEKLFEDILSAEEGTEATWHDRIYVARGQASVGRDALHRGLLALRAGLQSGDRQELIAHLRDIVPTYRAYEAPVITPAAPSAAVVAEAAR